MGKQFKQDELIHQAQSQDIDNDTQIVSSDTKINPVQSFNTHLPLDAAPLSPMTKLTPFFQPVNNGSLNLYASPQVASMDSINSPFTVSARKNPADFDIDEHNRRYEILHNVFDGRAVVPGGLNQFLQELKLSKKISGTSGAFLTAYRSKTVGNDKNKDEDDICDLILLSAFIRAINKQTLTQLMNSLYKNVAKLSTGIAIQKLVINGKLILLEQIKDLTVETLNDITLSESIISDLVTEVKKDQTAVQTASIQKEGAVMGLDKATKVITETENNSGIIIDKGYSNDPAETTIYFKGTNSAGQPIYTKATFDENGAPYFTALSAHDFQGLESNNTSCDFYTRPGHYKDETGHTVFGVQTYWGEQPESLEAYENNAILTFMKINRVEPEQITPHINEYVTGQNLVSGAIIGLSQADKNLTVAQQRLSFTQITLGAEIDKLSTAQSELTALKKQTTELTADIKARTIELKADIEKKEQLSSLLDELKTLANNPDSQDNAEEIEKFYKEKMNSILSDTQFDQYELTMSKFKQFDDLIDSSEATRLASTVSGDPKNTFNHLGQNSFDHFNGSHKPTFAFSVAANEHQTPDLSYQNETTTDIQMRNDPFMALNMTG